MKRFILILPLAFLLTSCAAMAQQFVDLPDTQETGIKVVVTALLALGFDFLIGVAPWLAFLRTYQEGFALALGFAAVNAIEKALPSGSDFVSIPAVGFVLAVALYLLGRTALQRRGVHGFV